MPKGNLTDRNFQQALSLVLKRAGGSVNHPVDPGGATNNSVTIATFRRNVKPNGVDYAVFDFGVNSDQTARSSTCRLLK